jgi:hypothetical protein
MIEKLIQRRGMYNTEQAKPMKVILMVHASSVYLRPL